MFIQIKDGEPFGYPVTDSNLRSIIQKNVSVPQFPVTADIIQFGFAVYEYAAKPEFPLSNFKVVEEGTPQWANDSVRGDYITQVWTVRDMTQSEKDEATNQKWLDVRYERNILLQLCDWTQLPDAPLSEEQKTAWQAYRQALRDVTQQSDPFEIIWPEKPE